jgi:hypothetical protein
VPARELQNFTPKVTALESASTGLAGTALPKKLIGDCASDVVLIEHAIGSIKNKTPNLRSADNSGIRMIDKPTRPTPKVGNRRTMRVIGQPLY